MKFRAVIKKEAIGGLVASDLLGERQEDRGKNCGVLRIGAEDMLQAPVELDNEEELIAIKISRLCPMTTDPGGPRVAEVERQPESRLP